MFRGWGKPAHERIFFCTVPLIPMHACINSPETVSLKKDAYRWVEDENLEDDDNEGEEGDGDHGHDHAHIVQKHLCIMNTVLPTLCTTFRPVQKKNSAAKGKKMRSPSNFNFLKKFGPQKHYFCLCVSGKISWTSLELERIWGRKQFFIMFGPFSALFVQSRPKFSRGFVRPLHF